MRRIINIRLVLMIFLCALLPGGCATHNTKTVKQETVEYSADEADPSANPVVVEKRTTETTETTEGGDSGGVLSGTIHAAGEVLALPFRAVGGLIGVIF